MRLSRILAGLCSRAPGAQSVSTVRAPSLPTPRGAPASLHPPVAQLARQGPPDATRARRRSRDKRCRRVRKQAKRSVWRAKARRWLPRGGVVTSRLMTTSTTRATPCCCCAPTFLSRPRCCPASRSLLSSRSPCRVASRSTSGRSCSRSIPLPIRSPAPTAIHCLC